jgi:uncharacterized protein GlcG (DUF336 family)
MNISAGCSSLVFACAIALVACSDQPPPPGSGPSYTQAGSAADMERGPRAGAAPSTCDDLPKAAELKKWLLDSPQQGGEAGGLFSGKRQWASIVDRRGVICATAVATEDPAAAWPGSQAIAKAKAYTANSYSTDDMPLSTARLYTLTQPGHSLWGVAQANPFSPQCVVEPRDAARTNGRVCGGAISFGGGVPLYRGKTRVGGLGVSGDTACADHEIAKRIRHMAGLDPEKGPTVDDITYTSADGPSPFAHPLCANTWRNGQKLGDETPATGY